MSEEIDLERELSRGKVIAFLFREDGNCRKTEIDLDEALFELAKGDKKRSDTR